MFDVGFRFRIESVIRDVGLKGLGSKQLSRGRVEYEMSRTVEPGYVSLIPHRGVMGRALGDYVSPESLSGVVWRKRGEG